MLQAMQVRKTIQGLLLIIMSFGIGEFASASCFEAFQETTKGLSNQSKSQIQNRSKDHRLKPVVERRDQSKLQKITYDINDILMQEWELNSLISSDPQENLAFQHPGIIMGAFERVATVVQIEGRSEGFMSNFRKEKTETWNIFDRPSPLNNGRYIVGAHDAKNALITTILAGAAGNREAKKSLPVLLGGSGTGKTEYLEIISKAGELLSATDPNFYQFTFEWRGLQNIPSLRPFVPSSKDPETGKIHYSAMPSALMQSPFVLLPQSYQQVVKDFAKERAVEVSGFEPNPQTQVGPQSAHIMKELYEFYTAQKKAKDPSFELTAEAKLDILNKHIRIRRRVFGASGKKASVGVQAKDVDIDGLIGSANPLVRMEHGPGHPFAYYLNGKIIEGNGFILYLDEFFRNEEALRNKFLDIIGSRKIERGGMPTIPFDALIIGATNNESIVDARQEGNSLAQLSRARLIPMERSLHPFENMEVAILMNGPENWVMRPLGENSSPKTQTQEGMNQGQLSWKPLEIKEVFRLAQDKDGFYSGPTGRYALAVKNHGDGPLVEFAPHSLELMAAVTSLTRMIFDPNRIQELGDNDNTNYDAIATNPIARLELLLGMDRETGFAERDQLQKLSNFLNEGEFGLDHRDVAKAWLTDVIAEAAKPENDYTVTVQMVRNVFQRLLNEQNGFKHSSNQERLLWNRYLDEVLRGITLQNIERDIMAALGSTEGDINRVYDDVWAQILTLNKDPNATQYRTAEGNRVDIDHAKLEAVSESYVELFNERIPTDQILSTAAYPSANRGDQYRDPRLQKAISNILAESAIEQISFGGLASYAQTGQGSHETGSRYNALQRVLIERYGYNERSAREAIQFVNSMRRKIENKEENQ